MKQTFALSAACSRRWLRRPLAQQRPLVTEDPETVGAGNILIEGGFDAQRDVVYPASGLTGDLLRAADARRQLRLQLDPRAADRRRVLQPAEHHVDRAGAAFGQARAHRRQHDRLRGHRRRHQDPASCRKAPGRPSFGIRLATKLPIAGNESGLGLDTMDFSLVGLFGKTVQSVRVVGNFGLGILSDPIEGDRQNDVITLRLLDRPRAHAGARDGR